MADRIRYSIVLLAGGGSRRMGRPKQLLPIRGKPLVRYMAELALTVPDASVVVVLGAEGEQIQSVLNDLPVVVATNPDWQAGLSSSLRVGVRAAMLHSPDIEAVIVCLADQPRLTLEHLQRLIARYGKGDCTAVASLADEVPVPPILFHRSWFDRLCTIQGDIGARALLRDHDEAIATIPIATAVDLDTPEDYERFVS